MTQQQFANPSYTLACVLFVARRSGCIPFSELETELSSWFREPDTPGPFGKSL